MLLILWRADMTILINNNELRRRILELKKNQMAAGDKKKRSRINFY
jgi:hypothetical protein